MENDKRPTFIIHSGSNKLGVRIAEGVFLDIIGRVVVYKDEPGGLKPGAHGLNLPYSDVASIDVDGRRIWTNNSPGGGQDVQAVGALLLKLFADSQELKAFIEGSRIQIEKLGLIFAS